MLFGQAHVFWGFFGRHLNLHVLQNDPAEKPADIELMASLFVSAERFRRQMSRDVLFRRHNVFPFPTCVDEMPSTQIEDAYAGAA